MKMAKTSNTHRDAVAAEYAKRAALRSIPKNDRSTEEIVRSRVATATTVKNSTQSVKASHAK